MKAIWTGLLLLAVAAPTVAEDAKPDLKAALGWLSRHQEEDGSWSVTKWNGRCTQGGCNGPGNAYGDQRYDAGVTALCLLALVEGGNTQTKGEFSESVKKAVAYLLGKQLENGAIAYSAGDGESIYNHAVAAQAFCALFERGEVALKGPAEKAIAFCLEAQNPKLGWKYGIKSGRNDTSVTTWMVMALAKGWSAGIEVPQGSIEGALRWYERATDAAGNAGYESPGGGSAFFPHNEGKYDVVPAMTAASVLGQLLAGVRRSNDRVRKGTKLLLEALPAWTPDATRGCNFYYWLMATRSLALVGGKGAETWNTTLRAVLAARQRTKACEAGSWDPVGEWCLAGGRPMATALNALSAAQLLGAATLEPVSVRVLPNSEWLVVGDYGLEVGYASADKKVLKIYVSTPAGRPLELPPGAKGKVKATVKIRNKKRSKKVTTRLVALEPEELGGKLRYGFRSSIKVQKSWEEATAEVEIEGLGEGGLVFQINLMR